MSGLLWVKMPSQWIANGGLVKQFNSNKIADEIAALKIFISLAISSKIVTRRHYLDPIGEIYIDHFEASRTYDQLMDMTSLSRSLISRGIKKLIKENIIKVDGTTRKKKYVLLGSPKKGWCKMPSKELIKINDEISPFKHFTQRYAFERDALKLFLYLVSIRSNSKRFVDVSHGQIFKKTGIKVHERDGVVGFMKSVGLIEKSESRGYLKIENRNESYEFQKLHRYWVTGCKTLNLRRSYELSDD